MKSCRRPQSKGALVRWRVIALPIHPDCSSVPLLPLAAGLALQLLKLGRGFVQDSSGFQAQQVHDLTWTHCAHFSDPRSLPHLAALTVTAGRREMGATRRTAQGKQHENKGLRSNSIGWAVRPLRVRLSAAMAFLIVLALRLRSIGASALTRGSWGPQSRALHHHFGWLCRTAKGECELGKRVCAGASSPDEREIVQPSHRQNALVLKCLSRPPCPAARRVQ